MTHEILAAGFGGQGVLSMGMTLAYAGMVEGKEIPYRIGRIQWFR